jgi:thiamine-phosphate pyrophosphorylase
MNMDSGKQKTGNGKRDVSARQYSRALPRLMLITERHAMQPSTSDALQSALKGGAQLIQLREKDLPPAELLALAREFQWHCAAFNSRLIINSEVEIAQEIGAGLHLPESEVLRLPIARRALGNEVLIGASAHSREAAQHAVDQGADYIVFGSVFETVSHPGSTPAGLQKLSEVCSAIKIPVFAVGGITARHARACREAEAHGVAVIRAVWSTPDVETAVRHLIKVLEL